MVLWEMCLQPEGGRESRGRVGVLLDALGRTGGARGAARIVRGRVTVGIALIASHLICPALAKLPILLVI